MRAFSRWMPPTLRGSRGVAVLLAAVIALAAAWLVVRHPWTVAIAGVVIVVSAFLDRRRLVRLRAIHQLSSREPEHARDTR